MMIALHRQAMRLMQAKVGWRIVSAQLTNIFPEAHLQ